MNSFTYNIGATQYVQNSLISWNYKSREYIEIYYGEQDRTYGTQFGDCVSKIVHLIENFGDREISGNYRSVQDREGLLQAAAIIEVQEIDVEEQRLTGLAIESLSNAPWNVIEVPQPETRKGAATSLIEEIVRESQTLGYNGILKAITVPRARPFYRRIGFIETNGSGEMILTQDAAVEFLLEQEQRRQSQTFD